MSCTSPYIHRWMWRWYQLVHHAQTLLTWPQPPIPRRREWSRALEGISDYLVMTQIVIWLCYPSKNWRPLCQKSQGGVLHPNIQNLEKISSRSDWAWAQHLPRSHLIIEIYFNSSSVFHRCNKFLHLGTMFPESPLHFDVHLFFH